LPCFAARIPNRPNGQSGKNLHLIGALFRRTANPAIKPRKPLVFFIEGIFRVAIIKHKRFSNMGTVAKLLYKKLVSCLALRAITSRIPRHPIVVQKNKNKYCVYPYACGICVPFSLHYVPGASFVPHTDSRYYITLSLQTYTSAPHNFREILISIPQATYIPFSHKLFPTHFQWCFLFSATSLPQNSLIFPTTH